MSWAALPVDISVLLHGFSSHSHCETLQKTAIPADKAFEGFSYVAGLIGVADVLLLLSDGASEEGSASSVIRALSLSAELIATCRHQLQNGPHSLEHYTRDTDGTF